ncbi:DEBR0S1_09230g1_1 [Brettanomyces bruxellensis]|uniref:DEBR0S1_09230g1_1 n=1 Tax=Dekkera bruxellensis TaxID=5007 RepID=A0A7D9CUX9_DEKBR|nr:DEBR0S1_09230g1_1 [Brettanomyces bruxellensis]
MAPVNAMEEPGIVTLEVLDEYSGKNNVEGELHPKPSIFLRDVAITYQLKLKSARRLLSRVDKLQPVYPFKLSEVSAHFPLNLSDVHSFGAQISNIHDDMKPDRLGLAEMINQRLVVPKPIWAVRFIPLKQVLKGTSSTGARGYDAENPTLPGMELPLPKLGISALQLKSSLKYAKKLPAARELNTIVIDETNKEILRLSGGIDACKPSWVHSNYQLTGLLAQCVSELNKFITRSPFRSQN